MYAVQIIQKLNIQLWNWLVLKGNLDNQCQIQSIAFEVTLYVGTFRLYLHGFLREG